MTTNEKKNAIRIETVKTGSFTMDYFRFGRGKEILVILPGLSIQSVMGLADAVADAYRQLVNDFTIYVFDRRNELPAFYSINDMANDTAEALRIAGLKNINVFGVSQGGMIAMEIAIAHPELVKKLILCSTVARVTQPFYKTIEKWVYLARERKTTDLFLTFGESIYPQRVFESAKTILLDAAKTVTETDLDRFIILAKSMRNFDVTQTLEKISCPVLVTGDSEDRLLGAESVDQIAKIMKRNVGVESYLYHGYGHAVYDLAPDYKERILHFLVQNDSHY